MSVFTATQPPVLTFEALVLCNDTDFPVLMSTVYTESFATDEHSLYDLIPGNVTNPGFRLYSYFLDLGTDLLDSGLAGQFSSAGSTITILEPPVFCHNQRLGAIDQSCTAVPVNISSASSILTSINGTIYRVWTSELPEPLLGIMTSATQLFLAVVRLDIGNAFPNNFLVHPDTLNATISSNITLYGDCLDTLQQMDSVFPGLGDMSRPATIASQYLCHFPHRKPLGSAIISVLVATLTMFGSGWTVFLLVAKLYEQRKYPQGKSCDCHLSEYERVGNNELQEGYGSVSLQGPRRDGV
ncbi:hypothetical protein FRB93_002146 [Tulasnella sp. JGI-2019a]|nr:hypothetical protein FRB93_002146 [Tulasnella sp. JGI-2019a]